MNLSFHSLVISAALSSTFAYTTTFAQEKLSQQQTVNAWQKVETAKVCMVTDMVFPRTQIPVKVEGKTYYGCCHNCKDRLANDSAVRYAVDPVNGKKVDKANAVIAAGPDGSVKYFESDVTLKTFLSSSK